MNRRELLAGIAGALLFACAKADSPIDPVWGKEPCAHCRMLVSERRYAAQAAADGERKFFDDIGCMVLWVAENKAERVWVQDPEQNRWVDAKSARYVEGAKTPMDYGFEARAEGAPPKAPGAGENSIGWDEMRDRVIAKGKKR